MPRACSASSNFVWTGSPVQGLGNLWALAPNDVLSSGSAGLMRWDGSAWTLVSPQPPFQGIVQGTADDDIWILNNVSLLAHWDGATWTDLSFGPSASSHAWASWASGRNEAWLAVANPLSDGNTQPALYHLKSGIWSQVPSPLDGLTNVYLDAFWSSAPDDVWVGGDIVGPLANGHLFIKAAILHWDGSNWTSPAPAAMQEDGQIIEDFWGTSSHDVWAAGGGKDGLAELWHFDGSDWTEATIPSAGPGYFGRLWGTCPSDFWAFGPIGGITSIAWHYDGISWSPVTQPFTVYTAGKSTTVQPSGRMTGSSPDDVWVTASTGNTCFQPGTSFVLHRRPPRCGDGIVSPGEECDPPSQGPDGFQCDSSCHRSRCGNGIIDSGEECDPPATGRCDQTCHVPTCGNRVVDPGEDCDPPGTSTCDAQCHATPVVCGNGIVQPGETCDAPDGLLCRSCAVTCCGSCFIASMGPQMGLARSICQGSDSACVSSCQSAPEVCTTLTGSAQSDCQLALNCMVPGLGSCAAGANGPLGCYCTNQSCSAGADGPCATQIQAVAKTTDTAEIKRQMGDFTTTLGRLAVEVKGFTQSSCGRACTNGISVCGYP